METEVFLDTHLLLWLYAGEVERISEKAKLILEDATLLASPISLLEVDYLYEIEKIKIRGEPVFKELQEQLQLQIAEDPFLSIVQVASHLSWTRDPFDRLLIAHAKLRKAPLLTKDRLLKKHYPHCIW